MDDSCVVLIFTCAVVGALFSNGGEDPWVLTSDLATFGEALFICLEEALFICFGIDTDMSCLSTVLVSAFTTWSWIG